MYDIKILHGKQELNWTTEYRSRARSVKALCNENNVECEVTQYVPEASRPVKFRGID